MIVFGLLGLLWVLMLSYLAFEASREQTAFRDKRRDKRRNEWRQWRHRQ